MVNSKSEKSNTGYKGIYFIKGDGKFRAYLKISPNILNEHIGMFDTLKEAIKAREDFIKSLF